MENHWVTLGGERSLEKARLPQAMVAGSNVHQASNIGGSFLPALAFFWAKAEAAGEDSELQVRNVGKVLGEHHAMGLSSL